MFETVVPETVAPRSRRLQYETLPVSLTLHSVVAASLLLATIWNAEFPRMPPKMYAAYSLAEPPPPPPPPPPLPATKRVLPQIRPVRLPDVAPTVIPDTIPDPVEPPVEVAAADVEGVAGGIEGGEEGGVVGGIPDSVVIEPPPPPPAPAILEVARDAPLPMGAISQDFPTYPEFARTRGWQDELVVRYLIGKDGRVKDVSVIRPPDRDEFVRPTVSAIRHWRFHPFRDDKGAPKEVVHELTVQFKIARPKS